MSLRLAAATEDFGQPLRTAIAEAAKNQIHGLRLNARTELRSDDFSETALRQLRLYVQEHQMQVAGLMYSSRHSLYDEASLDQRLNGIRTAMGMVRKLGTTEVLVRVGRIPDPTSKEAPVAPGQPTNSDVDSLRNPFSYAPSMGLKSVSGPSEAQLFNMLCDITNDLAGFASHCGATLQLQLSAFDPVRIETFMNRIQAGPVGLVFDPATCVMTGTKPVAIFRDLYRHIGYVRARDARHDIDGAGLEVSFGDGSVDWIELIPTLIEADFSGWFCIERTGGDQRSIDVSHAVRQLRQLLPLG